MCSLSSFSRYTTVSCSFCNTVGLDFGQSLSVCAAKACSENSNAFNFKPNDGLCARKQCSNGVWEYTSMNGHCDVYALAGKFFFFY